MLTPKKQVVPARRSRLQLRTESQRSFRLVRMVIFGRRMTFWLRRVLHRRERFAGIAGYGNQGAGADQRNYERIGNGGYPRWRRQQVIAFPAQRCSTCSRSARTAAYLRKPIAPCVRVSVALLVAITVFVADGCSKATQLRGVLASDSPCPVGEAKLCPLDRECNEGTPQPQIRIGESVEPSK